ncbi:hypothetical protein [Aquimarina sp. 2304DJ70-9]|uniref:hypothetical protein n=1 Tax=Aquimarina penaris TaxID=3231044 RepID=UPI003461DA6A
MKKTIFNIEGVQVLNKKQQAKIKASAIDDCCAANAGASSGAVGAGLFLGAIIDWVCLCNEQQQ